MPPGTTLLHYLVCPRYYIEKAEATLLDWMANPRIMLDLPCEHHLVMGWQAIPEDAAPSTIDVEHPDSYYTN
jgi:hypothetical protein